MADRNALLFHTFKYNIDGEGLSVDQKDDTCHTFLKVTGKTSDIKTVACTADKSKFLCEQVIHSEQDNEVDVKASFFNRLSDDSEYFSHFAIKSDLY